MRAMDNQDPTALSATGVNWDYHDNYEYGNDLISEKSGDLVLLSFTVIFCLFGMFANGTVVYYLGFRIRRSHLTMDFLNLAILDFIFLLVFSCSALFLMFHEDVAIGMYTISDLPAALCMLRYDVSQYFHAAIGVEMSTSVLFPIRYRSCRSKLQCTTVCAIFWVLSGVELVVDLISCLHYESCVIIATIQAAISFLILLPLTVLSNMALVILICQRSLRQYPLRLCVLIITTTFAFLVLSVTLSLILFLEDFGLPITGYSMTAFVSPSVNCILNPVIYFLVGGLGRQRTCSIAASLRRAFEEESESSQL